MGHPSYSRAERLAGLLKKRLSQIIQSDLRDPRIGFVTITDVQASKDLRHVKVYFSVLGSEKEKNSAIIGLGRAAGFIRRIISQELGMRFSPEIVFKFDETYEHGQRINALFDKLKKDEEERDERNKKGN